MGEPSRLKHGKLMHKQIQAEWQSAEGEVSAEKQIIKPSGGSGRVDVFVEVGDQHVAVVEIKASDWDAMTEKAVRKNVARYSRQVWSYIESQLSKDRDVSPGIVFTQRPADVNRMTRIEKLFEQQGIPVVWNDESIEERRARSCTDAHSEPQPMPDANDHSKLTRRRD